LFEGQCAKAKFTSHQPSAALSPHSHSVQGVIHSLVVTTIIMAIREDLVASAVQFLQDPSVASSPLEKRVAFLQAKNLTQEEVDAAISRCQSTGAVAQSYQPPPGAVSAPPAQQSPAYYGQPYPQQQYPPYAWPQQPPAPPRRDWRDWFIMATVVSGVSYGMYSLGKVCFWSCFVRFV